jgi:hypothetical protein
VGPFDDGSEEPSERTRSDAERIVEQLVGGRHGVDVVDDESLVLSDVDEDASRYTGQLQWLDYLGFPAPAIKLSDEDGDFVPMDLGLLGRQGDSSEMFDVNPETAWMYQSDQSLGRVLERGLDRARTEIEDFVTVPVEAAQWKFRERLIEFVGTRLGAVRSFQRGRSAWSAAVPLQLPRRSGGRPITTPGCTFVVTTNSNGLRVLWTGAYLMSSNFFSSPTSPATSVLQSGAYRFGVDGGAYRRIKWDHTVITLPGSPAIHLNF